jgi:hypothetical protein
MTYCSTLGKPLLEHIEAKKSLDEIGREICGNSVKNPRRKAIRLIRILLGEKTLVDFADSLKYEISKARKGNPFLRRKNSAENESDAMGMLGNCTSERMEPSAPSGDTECSDNYTEPKYVIEAIRLIISRCGFDRVRKAWETIISEISPVKETNPVKKYEPIVSEEVAASGQDKINKSDNAVVVSPLVTKTLANEQELKITDYVRYHPYCRLLDIAFSLKFNIIALIRPLESLTKKGVLIKTEQDLYVLKDSVLEAF